MATFSILFPDPADDSRAGRNEPPSFFADLNLDQVVDAITATKGPYDLKPFFYTSLRNTDAVRYRHEVMKDLEDPGVLAALDAFAGRMNSLRLYLAFADKQSSRYHKEGWFLEAALVHCEAAQQLALDLGNGKLISRGLLTFRRFLQEYTHSEGFQALLEEAARVKRALRGVRYSINIQFGRFSVRRADGGTDYSSEVEQTFERFREGAVKDYRMELTGGSGITHIEAKILDFVARLYPVEFGSLSHFCEAHPDFVDDTLQAFDREIQFYISFREFAESIKRKGLSFCYPEVSATSRAEFANTTFDLALARSLLYTETPVICNDYYLSDPERVIVVSGPNQGGKTTFARTFGQLHYLASLGLPVPGERAALFLCDQICSHFDRAEDIRDLTGKLANDLLRIHDILARLTARSVLILNEIFASTTLADAVFLSKEIMAKVIELDVLCVWVTFIDELSTFSEKSVSMVSTVVPEDPAVRTFKIVRKPADGLAYALSIAEKNHVTYRQILERLPA